MELLISAGCEEICGLPRLLLSVEMYALHARHADMNFYNWMQQGRQAHMLHLSLVGPWRDL